MKMNAAIVIEPLGKSEGGKEPPSRSIKQFFKLKKFEKLGRQRGEKTFSTRCLVLNGKPVRTLVISAGSRYN